jgi:GTPase SAR1 family protein
MREINIKITSLDINEFSLNTTKEFNFKKIMIGEMGVGKTSIISKGVDNTFNENYKSTLCFDHS